MFTTILLVIHLRSIVIHILCRSNYINRCLFICALFNDAVTSTEYTVSKSVLDESVYELNKTTKYITYVLLDIRRDVANRTLRLSVRKSLLSLKII